MIKGCIIKQSYSKIQNKMRYFLIFFILVLFAKCSSVPKECLTNSDTYYYIDSFFN